MKFTSSSTVRVVGCGFLPRCAIRFCCTTPHAVPWVTSAACGCEMAASSINGKVAVSTASPFSRFCGACAWPASGRTVGSSSSWTTPSTTMRFYTKTGAADTPNASPSISCLPTARTSTRSSASGNSPAGLVFTIATSRTWKTSSTTSRLNSTAGAEETRLFADYAQFIGTLCVTFVADKRQTSSCSPSLRLTPAAGGRGAHPRRNFTDRRLAVPPVCWGGCCRR